MGLEAATFIHQLNPSWPLGPSDPVGQGDDNIRMLKACLQATFPNILGAMTASHTNLNAINVAAALPTNKIKATGVAAAGFGGAMRVDAQILIDLADTYGWTGQHSWTASLLANAGIAVGYSFSGDTDTGIGRPSADAIGIFAGGVNQFTVNTTALLPSLPIRPINGTAAAPVYSWSGEPDMGFFRDVANKTSFGVAATKAVMFSGQGVENRDGVVGAPSYSFFNDLDTGFYRAATGEVRYAADGALSWIVRANGAFFIDGSAANPGISYINDPDTGWYRAGSGDLRAACDGTLILALRSTAAGASVFKSNVLFPDGTTGAPSITFENDSDSGFKKGAAADQIDISLGGVSAGQIAQGTFTATLTGCTTSPTVTVNYQRVGKIVELWVTASLLATSNSAACTITGLPAVVTPTNTKVGVCTDLNDNGNNDLLAKFSVLNTGVVQFNLYATGVVAARVQAGGTFTAAGTKGLSSTWRISYPVD